MILTTKNLNKSFTQKGSFLKDSVSFKVLKEISLELKEGKTLAIIGESGCGKSTLAKLIVGIEMADSGLINYKGTNITALGAKRPLSMVKDIQMVFQNPYASLNPRQKIIDIVCEPLIIHGQKNKEKNRQAAASILSKVGLSSDILGRYPHMLSGGQRQRVAIARSIILNPSLIVLDEPVSALDLSVQAQVLNLLQDLKKDLNLSYIFISHNIETVKYFADNVIVMYLGHIVESGPSQEVLNNSRHPYTKALIASSFNIKDYKKKKIVPISGEIPSPLNPPSGCPFITRCNIAEESCAKAFPDSTNYPKDHRVNCYKAGD